MEQNLDIVEHVSKLLDSGKYKDAVSVPTEQKYKDTFKDNCWDLISVIIGKIQDNTIIIKPSLYGACEQLLLIIVQEAVPEEALLEFIEQVELAKNDAQFGLILKPLQQLLEKLSLKRGRSLEWCLNSISSYIENIPIPKHELEGKECLLMDCDPNIRRIIKVYSMLPTFYAPFIKELTGSESNTKTKEIINAFLISLFGKPLIYIDMDPETSAKSEARQYCNMILQDVCMLEKNILKFLVYLESCHKGNQKSVSNTDNSDDEKSPYEHTEKLNMTTLSGLYYAVYSGHFEILNNAIPQVYNTEYVIYTLTLAVIHLLSFTEYSPLAKAIALCKAVLDRFSINVSYTLLSSSIHFELCKCLSNVAIYSTYETIRKNAVNLIGVHINKFDYKGRCMLIKHLIGTSNHSGMIGYSITLYKNSIDEAFKKSVFPECFTGAQLMIMVKKICYLPYGAESDLVELADQIITTLNFLRYLAIKDIKNITGIRGYFSTIETEYLEVLRSGLNMSKAHYEVKLKDIEEGKNLPEESVNVSFNVGGKLLDKIPTENKKEIINSALNAFHLIEGLMARLSECINLNKMQGLKVDLLRSRHRHVLPVTSLSVTKSQRLIRNYCQKSYEYEYKAEALVSTEHEEQQYEDNIKHHILERALDFVSKSGWSAESISAGAEAAGYPGVAHGLFPNGGGDLVHFFNVRCNDELVKHMKNWPKEDLKESKVPAKFIENAIMTRLLMIEPYKNTWPKAMAIQALPHNVPNCLATLLSLVDDICYHSGDRSVDFNWYIRRVGLAGIYKASELFYLTDKSQENIATRNFVNSRIGDAQLIQSAINLNPVSAGPQTLSGAFVTAKNILGINTLK